MIAQQQNMRRAVEMQEYNDIKSAEADAKRVVAIRTEIRTLPQTLQRLAEETAAMQQQIATQTVELARLQSITKNASSHFNPDYWSIVEARQEAIKAQEKASQAEGEAAAAMKGANAAKTGALSAELKTRTLSTEIANTPFPPPPKKPPVYRPVYRWADWIRQPSLQPRLAAVALLLALVGLLVPATCQFHAAWIVCIFGLPSVVAALVREYLREFFLHSTREGMGIVVDAVPIGVASVLAVALWHGFRGAHFFLGAWVGKTVGCLIPAMLFNPWEVAAVRLIFMLCALAIVDAFLHERAELLDSVAGQLKQCYDYMLGLVHDFLRKLHDPEVDEPGIYVITHDNTLVGTTSSLDSDDIDKLSVGTEVEVVELVTMHEEHRLRAKIKDPEGWISLLNTETGRRWAAQKADTIGGHWAGRATIEGSDLIWSNGHVDHLTSRTDSTLEVIMDGEPHTAELKSDGKLYWSDGDIWVRKANGATKMCFEPTPNSEAKVMISRWWSSCESEEFCRHLGIYSFVAFCSLLLSTSLSFKASDVLGSSVTHATHALSWLDIAKALLGDHESQDELGGLWLLGAFVWLATVVLRVGFYFWKENQRPEQHLVLDRPEHRQRSFSSRVSHLSLGQEKLGASRTRADPDCDRSQSERSTGMIAARREKDETLKIDPNVLLSAASVSIDHMKQQRELQSQFDTEPAAHEVVSLIARWAGDLRQLRSSVRSVEQILSEQPHNM
jgi:hypothetical protein